MSWLFVWWGGVCTSVCVCVSGVTDDINHRQSQRNVFFQLTLCNFFRASKTVSDIIIILYPHPTMQINFSHTSIHIFLTGEGRIERNKGSNQEMKNKDRDRACAKSGKRGAGVRREESKWENEGYRLPRGTV